MVVERELLTKDMLSALMSVAALAAVVAQTQ
jgi:hypothetical protein